VHIQRNLQPDSLHFFKPPVGTLTNITLDLQEPTCTDYEGSWCSAIPLVSPTTRAFRDSGSWSYQENFLTKISFVLASGYHWYLPESFAQTQHFHNYIRHFNATSFATYPLGQHLAQKRNPPKRLAWSSGYDYLDEAIKFFIDRTD